MERVDGLILYIRDSDLLDGTPVLDLKPYVAYTDSHPEAGAGWLSDPVKTYTVTLDPLAAEQVAWIETRTGLPIRERIESTLALGPEPHPYRRIKPIGDHMQLAVKEWRVHFSFSGHDVRVLNIVSGFRNSQLMSDNPQAGVIPHREFVALWPIK
jgi:hypothetical protein